LLCLAVSADEQCIEFVSANSPLLRVTKHSQSPCLMASVAVYARGLLISSLDTEHPYTTLRYRRVLYLEEQSPNTAIYGDSAFDWRSSVALTSSPV